MNARTTLTTIVALLVMLLLGAFASNAFDGALLSIAYAKSRPAVDRAMAEQIILAAEVRGRSTMGWWQLAAAFIAAAATIGVGFLSLTGVLKSNARSAEQRLRVEHHLRLLFLAHEAIGKVTDVGADAFEVLATMNTKTSVTTDPAHAAAFRMRQTFGKAAVHLPPELDADFDALESAYARADAGILHENRPTPYQGMRDLEEFQNAMAAWRQSARAWKTRAWAEVANRA